MADTSLLVSSQIPTASSLSECYTYAGPRRTQNCFMKAELPLKAPDSWFISKLSNKTKTQKTIMTQVSNSECNRTNVLFCGSDVPTTKTATGAIMILMIVLFVSARCLYTGQLCLPCLDRFKHGIDGIWRLWMKLKSRWSSDDDQPGYCWTKAFHWRARRGLRLRWGAHISVRRFKKLRNEMKWLVVPHHVRASHFKNSRPVHHVYEGHGPDLIMRYGTVGAPEPIVRRQFRHIGAPNSIMAMYGRAIQSRVEQGYTPTDHETLQPSGEWKKVASTINGIDQHEMIHSGNYFPSTNTGKDGYCYLDCFAPAYHTIVSHGLGPYPTMSAFVNYTLERLRWLNYKGLMHFTVLSKPRRHQGVQKAVYHLIMLEREGNTVMSASQMAIHGQNAAINLLSSLREVQALIGGWIEDTRRHTQGVPYEVKELGPGRFTTDHDLTQPLGTWRVDRSLEQQGKCPLLHSGEYLPFAQSNIPGYCYTLAFTSRYRRTAALQLGPWPDTDRLASYALQRMDWLERRQTLTWERAKMEIPNEVPIHINHLTQVWDRGARQNFGVINHGLTGKAFILGLVRDRRDVVGGVILGRQGDHLLEPSHENFPDPLKDLTRAAEILTGPSRFSWDYSGKEDQGSLVWGLIGETKAAFSQVSDTWEPGEKVIMDHHNHAVCSSTIKHPGETIKGATRGLMFCSYEPDPANLSIIHPLWDVIFVPVETKHFNFLKQIKALGLVCGRADVTMATIYSENPSHKPGLLNECALREMPIMTMSKLNYVVNWDATSFAGAIFYVDEYDLYRVISNEWENSYTIESWLSLRQPNMVYTHGVIQWSSQPLPSISLPLFRVHCQGRDKGDAWIATPVSGLTEEEMKQKTILEMHSGHSGAFPCVESPWKSFEEAVSDLKQTAILYGYDSVSYDLRRRGRVGKRWVDSGECVHPDDSLGRDQGLIFPGAIWRPRDSCHGLRSRLAVTTTQGISPEIHTKIKAGDLQYEAFAYETFETARLKTIHWVNSRPLGDTICIASCFSPEHYRRFKNERNYLGKSWIIFTEEVFEVDHEDLIVVLPYQYGYGYCFQLARLLPLTGLARDDLTITCLNDLDTDWVPRTERYNVGRAALRYSPIVFPAMTLNMPCPFQDYVSIGGSIANLSHSLVATIASMGWLYGVDEVWTNTHGLPTVAVRNTLGGAAHPDVKNPVDSILLRFETGACRRITVPAGNFSKVYRTYGELVKPIKLDTDPVRNFPLVLPHFTWDIYQTARLSELYSAGYSVVAIILWGTRGDRVPLLAAARCLRRIGMLAVCLEAMTEAEGLQGLADCENNRGHTMVAPALRMRSIISALNFPVLYPSYLGKIRGKLGYALAPKPDESGRPKGGLVMPIDLLIPFIQFFQEDIWIAASNKIKYFPRSHNGTEFISPRENLGIYEKGVVTGSSTLPIPEKFSEWPLIPAGDHMSILPNYKIIACAGGAGVVQTAKACGCKVITWDDSIDRQWYNPDDAGSLVESGQNLNKWEILYPYLYPVKGFKVLFRRPSLIPHLAHFVWTRLTWGKSVWALIFTWTCISRSFLPMPTLESSIVRMILKSSGIAPAPLTVLFVTWGLRIVLGSSGKSPVWLAKTLSMELFKMATEPAFITLVMYSVPWVTALGISWVWVRLPEPGSLIGDIKTGIIDSTSCEGVWLVPSWVRVCGIPYAVHVALYDAGEAALYEGAHEEGTDMVLGDTFHFVRTERHSIKSFIVIKTGIPTGVLKHVRLTSKPYSYLWNCQSIVLMMMHRYSKGVAPIAFFAIWAGLINASGLLFIGTILLMFASAGSLTAYCVLRSFGYDDEHLKDRYTKFNNTVRRATFVAGTVLDPLSQIREAAIDLMHSAVLDGIDLDIASEAMRDTLAIELGAVATARYYQDRPEGPLEFTEKPNAFTAAVLRMASFLRESSLPNGAVEWCFRLLLMLGNMTNQCLELTMTIIVFLLCPLLDLAESANVEKLNDFLAEVQDALEIQTLKKKNAWIPLPLRTPKKLNFVGWMAVTMSNSFQVPGGDPFEEITNHLNRFRPASEDPLHAHASFLRPTYRPKNPRISTYELNYPTLLHEVAYRIDPILEERVARYEAMGATPGTDGVWLASQEWQDENIKMRYLAHGKPYSADESDLMLECVDMLYKKHKEAFDSPGIVTPGTVAAQLIKKYSSGLPFLDRYPKRHQLWASGWMSTLIQSTLKRLQEGTVPPQLYHNFPKMQIVTKPRMVTAEGLASAFVSQVTQLEADKRPVWDKVGFGMGAKINASYLGEIFEKVSTRQRAFTADVTDFDSNVPPLIYEGLAQLKHKGIQAGGVPAVAKIQRAKYFAMQNATMINLETGTVIPKNRGGATGQSATSWDNHWGFRLSMVMIWAAATGLPPSQFYDFNTVHNTGDDNVWGTDSDISPEQLSKAAKDLLGFDLRIETTGDVTDLNYLSRLCQKTEAHLEDAEIAGIKTKFVAVFDRKRTMLRRSAVNTRYSGRPHLEYHKHLLERSVGHLINCAFDRKMYSIILSEYIEDADTFVGAPNALIWDTTADSNGFLMSATPRLAEGSEVSKAAERRFRKLKTSLKAPTYRRVLQLAGSTQTPSTGISKYKASYLDAALPDLINAYFTEFRSNLNHYLPDYLAKLRAQVDVLPVTKPQHISGYPIEKYVWRTWYDKGVILSQSEFAIKCRESPFAPATDPNGFFWFTQLNGVKEEIINANKAIIRGRAISAFLIYIGINNVLEWASRNPIIGVFASGYMITNRDLPRWYALLSSLYWVSEGTVSKPLAALMPRDPYAALKVISVSLCTLVPVSLCIAISKVSNGTWIEMVSNTASILLTYRPFKAPAEATLPRSNPWEEICDRILRFVGTHRNIILSSPTATGKSTMFIASVAKRMRGRIWLLTPRILLREQYANPFLTTFDVVKLQKGAHDEGQKVAIMTYGHYVARVKSGCGPKSGDLVIMDEFHENSPEQGLAVHNSPGLELIALSATPTLIYADHWPHFTAMIERPFGDVEVRRFDLNIEGLFAEALTEMAKTGDERALFIIPTIKEAGRFVQSLISGGHQATLLTRFEREVARTGSIVATQVVDSGIDINPGVNFVIDSGMMISQHKGNLELTPTDPATDEQRRGRTGRRGRGMAFSPSYAGTGRSPIPYPSWSQVCDDDDAREFLFSTLGISCKLEKFEKPSLLDPFMKLRGAFEPLIEASLEAYWYISQTCRNSAEADARYLLINARGFGEEDEHLGGLLNVHYKTTALITLEQLRPLLDHRPFEVIQNGQQITAIRISVAQDTVCAFRG